MIELEEAALPFDYQTPMVNIIQGPGHVEKLNRNLSSLTESARRNIGHHQRKKQHLFEKLQKMSLFSNSNDVQFSK